MNTPPQSPHYPPERTMSCPLAAKAARVANLSQDLAQEMRRLKNNLRHCPACNGGRDCPIMQAFNAQIFQAIQEVNTEWNL